MEVRKLTTELPVAQQIARSRCPRSSRPQREPAMNSATAAS